MSLLLRRFHSEQKLGRHSPAQNDNFECVYCHVGERMNSNGYCTTTGVRVSVQSGASIVTIDAYELTLVSQAS
jgi:hypothetical protein